MRPRKRGGAPLQGLPGFLGRGVLLTPGGEIWFKTDDGPLFRDSLRYFDAAGYDVFWQTEDLHAVPCEEELRVMTEHERMFTARGIPIKAARARLRAPQP